MWRVCETISGGADVTQYRVGFTAHVLTSLPYSQLSDAVFRIEGGRATLMEIAAMYGGRYEVVHVNGFPDSPFLTFAYQLNDQGKSTIGFDFATQTELSNRSKDLWEGHSWKGIKQLLQL